MSLRLQATHRMTGVEEAIAALIAALDSMPPDEAAAVAGRIEGVRLLYTRRALDDLTATRPPEDRQLSFAEAARIAGVSRRLLGRLRVPGRVRLGRRVLYSERELLRWLKRKREMP